MGVTDTDDVPLDVGFEPVENVKEFPYLGSVVISSGRMDADIDRKIEQASKRFEARSIPGS